MSSSVASPICQERQSKEPSRFWPFLPDFSSFSRFFPDFWQFFRCQGGHCAPLPYTGYATAREFFQAISAVLTQIVFVGCLRIIFYQKWWFFDIFFKKSSFLVKFDIKIGFSHFHSKNVYFIYTTIIV